jgi:hypothetical protein
MLLATRWTDLVVHEVSFVKEAIEIKKEKDLKVLNWKGDKNITNQNPNPRKTLGLEFMDRFIRMDDMWPFLGVVINTCMGMIQMPELQENWSKKFVCTMPFFQEVFERNRFL